MRDPHRWVKIGGVERVFPPEFLAQLLSLKHDLGKYVAWRSANFSSEEWQRGGAQVFASVREDILHTRKCADGSSMPAWAVFDAAESQMSERDRVTAAPELAQVRGRVRWLESVRDDIADDAKLGDPAFRDAIAAAQQEIRAELARLVARARA